LSRHKYEERWISLRLGEASSSLEGGKKKKESMIPKNKKKWPDARDLSWAVCVGRQDHRQAREGFPLPKNSPR